MSQFEEIFQVLRERRSVRQFLDEPIDPPTLRRLIEAANWAPSASNRQDWEFIIVTSGPVKKEMAEKVRSRWKALLSQIESGVTDTLREYVQTFDWFSQAPVVVAITTRVPETYLKHLLGDAAESVSGTRLSAGMAAQNLMLAAHALGIGSCCLTGPLAAQEDLKDLLDIGRRREIVCLVALGYPAEQPPAPGRKTVEEMTRTIE